MKIKFSEDVSDFLSLLSSHDVRYLIVGGEAVIYYGHTRLTGDIDIFYETSGANVRKLYLALNEFWNKNIPAVGNENELVQPGTIIQFGVPPNRIDMINNIEGVGFQEAWEHKVDEMISHHGDEISIHYIGIDDLIKNKKAVGRHKDIEDLKFLDQASKK